MPARKLRARSATIGVAAVVFSLAHGAFGQSPQPNPAPPDPSSSVPAASWQAMAGPDRSFTAELPAEPKYSTTPMRTSAGSGYVMHQYLVEQGDVAYVIQTAVYPADVNVSNHRANLQGGLDNAAKNMEGGKWANVGWTTHQGLTAVDAVGVRDNHAIRSYSVMKGRQIVTLTYAGPAGSARTADVDRFVGSLRVGP
jgi:hypothetical protein